MFLVGYRSGLPLCDSSKVWTIFLLLPSYVGGHGGLYKAPTKEERRKRKAERRERSDQVY